MFQVHIQLDEEAGPEDLVDCVLNTVRRISYYHNDSRNKEVEFLQALSDKIQERLIKINNERLFEKEF